MVGMEYCKHKTYGGTLVIAYASGSPTDKSTVSDQIITMPNG